MAKAPLALDSDRARHLWIAFQRLDSLAPFGTGPQATRAAIAHLGYVQIDTINVIECCHHHLLASLIPDYRRADLAQAPSVEKSVFEYWTHALSSVPSADVPNFIPAMKAQRSGLSRWFGTITLAEFRAMLARLRRDGPLSIADIGDIGDDGDDGDDELVGKTTPRPAASPPSSFSKRCSIRGTPPSRRARACSNPMI